MNDDVTIAGLSCGEMLALLGRFLDGTLDDETRRAFILHVGGCPRCERFGALYSAVVRKIRATARPADPDPGVLARLRARLDPTA